MNLIGYLRNYRHRDISDVDFPIMNLKLVNEPKLILGVRL